MSTWGVGGGATSHETSEVAPPALMQGERIGMKALGEGEERAGDPKAEDTREKVGQRPYRRFLGHVCGLRNNADRTLAAVKRDCQGTLVNF